jgi:hypothetical protein
MEKQFKWCFSIKDFVFVVSKLFIPRVVYYKFAFFKAVWSQSEPGSGDDFA